MQFYATLQIGSVSLSGEVGGSGFCLPADARLPQFRPVEIQDYQEIAAIPMNCSAIASCFSGASRAAFSLQAQRNQRRIAESVRLHWSVQRAAEISIFISGDAQRLTHVK
jgi:hypothetical protein